MPDNKNSARRFSFKARNNFTLIELLIVVAIIGVLASMLLPVLGKARGKARLAVCKNNLKQISYLLVMYQDDNDDYYPMINIEDTNISWDDSLSSYDGRNLSDTEMAENGLSSDYYSATYACPEDDVSRDDSSLAIFSYALNSNHPTAQQSFNERGISAQQADPTKLPKGSLRSSDINDSSNVIAASEFAKPDKYLGCKGRVRMGIIPTRFRDSSNGMTLFHKGIYGCNYAMVDGSVQYLRFFNTFISESDPGVAKGSMWDAMK